MPGHSPPRPRPPKPAVPAWALSIAIHVGLLIALFAVMNQEHGSPRAKRGSMGIVLYRSAEPGLFSNNLDPTIKQAAAFMEMPPAPLLLASTTAEANEPAATQPEATLPKPATTSTTAPPARPKPKPPKSAIKGSGRPTASSGVPGASGNGNYAQTSIFGVPGKGSKFIYVFDRSASMEGRPLAAAKQQLIQSVQSLDTVNQFHIIFFNTKTQSFDLTGGGHRIAFASDRNKKLAANFVGGITADGGTDRMYALKEALNFSPDVIFFLTDADDAMSPSEIAELARINQKVQASICVIEFGKGPPTNPNDFLARLAHDNRGQYGYVDTTKLR
jgi:hypothetical protein